MAADTDTRALATLLIDGLGLRAADLRVPLRTPTIAEYLPTVTAAATPNMRRTYGPYWTRAAEYFTARTIDELRTSDILAFQRHIVATARQRKNSRGGRTAGEHAIRALRCVYRLAVQDGLIRKEHNPAAKAPLPRRKRSTRRGLSSEEIADINDAVLAGGNDLVLDSLLLRLHLETACRRGGALNLRVQDLDTTYCRILLREKGGTLRWQPVSPTLAAALADHAAQRGAHQPTSALLRYRNGGALTSRRYDSMWKRVRGLVPWAEQLGVSTHWLRHTTLTWVERQYGYAIAHTYAGHSHDKGTTLIYTRGIAHEVATALSVLTDEPHPLAV